MVLLLTSPSGQPNELLSLLTSSQVPELALVQDSTVPLATSGSQVAWAIDATNGVDTNAGTPAAPLRTMAEFNRRYFGAVVSVAATLQLVGDVVDTCFMPAAVTFSFGASLTVLGTKTVVASGISVTSVTQRGDLGVGFPFELVTTGVDWTLQPINGQVAITASSNPALVGAIAFIMEVINANTVVLGAFTNPNSTSLTGAGSVTPLALDTLSLSSLSKALPPNVTCNGLGRSGLFSSALFTSQLTFKDLSIIQLPPGSALNVAQCYAGNCSLVLMGCESIVGISTIRCSTAVSWVACRFTLVQFCQISGGGVPVGIYQSVLSVDSGVKTTRFNFGGGNFIIARNGHNNAALRSSQGSVIEVNGPINIRNTTIPVFLEEFTKVWALAVIGGSTGNLDTSIRCQSGSSYAWNGAANKPTVLGTAGADEVRVGATQMTYVALGTGFYAAFNNANPNSILNLVGPGGGCWMAQF
jgi:hypothetical protein